MSVHIKRLCLPVTPTSTANKKNLANLQVGASPWMYHRKEETYHSLRRGRSIRSINCRTAPNLTTRPWVLIESHPWRTDIHWRSGQCQRKERTALEEVLFECLSTIRKLLKPYHNSTTTTAGTSADRSGVKLPKIDVLMFDGDILQWKQFWEQYCISVHDCTNLTDSEKMVYLRHPLKNGSAKAIIQGLAQSGEQYAEATKCLVFRFDRSQLIHHWSTRLTWGWSSISLNDMMGVKRSWRDCMTQSNNLPLRALKSMDEELSPSFITSTVELKLDSTTMFEWQRHTQSSKGIPHYHEILEFLDHRAQASEVSTPSKKQLKNDFTHQRKQHSHGHLKPVTSYATNLDSTDTQCPIYNHERHLLYSCTKFRSLPQDKIMTVKSNNLLKDIL